MNKITSDIYEISDAINKIQKKYIPDASEDTLTMGIYGFMNESLSNIAQNATIVASEWGNEAFPMRSKFEKTILTNAVTYNISDIHAKPAIMKVMLGFVQSDLDRVLDEKGKFAVNRNNKFEIGDYIYRLDYDIVISKVITSEGNVLYNARYDLSSYNPLSDIVNPYLQSPIMMTIDRNNFVLLSCHMRQIDEIIIHKKIISNSLLENKMLEFEFDEQLAYFEVIATDSDGTRQLIPIFEGVPILNEKNKYCFYTYTDANTIRVKFDRSSYQPKLNADIEIKVYNTLGSKGNFIYKKDVISSIYVDDLKVDNINAILRPISDSVGGVDRKSISNLKEIIPKEILSRGSITCNKDLENYFNEMGTNDRLLFYRRRDNQFERLYYAYMLVKDMGGNIVPTNTINMKLTSKDFNSIENDRFVLHPGTPIHNGEVIDISDKNVDELETNGFLYSSPYTVVINKSPLTISYFVNVIDRDYAFNYNYINQESELQFITSDLNLYNNYIKEKSMYKAKMTIVQNIQSERYIVEKDQFGNITRCKLHPIFVIENDHNRYYMEGDVEDYDSTAFSYELSFALASDNSITQDNKVKIKGMKIEGTDIETDVYVDENTKVSVYILLERDDTRQLSKFSSSYSFVNIPTLNDSVITTNRYDTETGVSFLYNYSHIINTKVKLDSVDEDGNYNFSLYGVPVVKYSYINDLDKCVEFIDVLQFRKAYIDNGLEILENSFGVDLKFFNTYGESKSILIGHNGEKLNKVNISLTFRAKLLPGANKEIREAIIDEAKTYMENINSISNIHMSNLVTVLTNKFKDDILFIEFVNINGYPSSYQYLERKEMDILEEVPEFINIENDKYFNPSIDIILV